MPFWNPDNQAEYELLGTQPVRKDGREKVTGSARYAADIYLEGMLFGGGLSAGIPNGKITRMDVSKAKAVEGVELIVTPYDVKKMISVSSHCYITDRPRFAGDIVALVAARTKEAVEEALAAIDVEYEAYPAVYSIKEAMAQGAPQVRDEYPGNRFTDACYSVSKGNVSAAWADCDVILEREYETQCAEHVYIEPEAAVAYINPADGAVTVHGCFQAPYYARRYIADFLGLPVARVKVVQETIGGTFGGKEDGMGMLAARTAYLSYQTKKPVKWVYSREESVTRTGKRHPYLFQFKVGAAKDGRILAWEGRQIANSGAYSNHTKFVNWRANVHAVGPYDIPNVNMETLAVFTNTPPSGAFRGYSSPQLIYAQEQMIDELAEALGMSEADVRRINCLKEGSEAVTGAPVENVTVGALMEETLKQTDYENKRRQYLAAEPCPGIKDRKEESYERDDGYQKGVENSQDDRFILQKTQAAPGGQHAQGGPGGAGAYKEGAQGSEAHPFLRKGIGMAISHRGCGFGAESPDATGTFIVADEDGSVTVNCSLTENGQGLRTLFTMITAETLGVPYDWVSFYGGDTQTIPDGGITAASRGTTAGSRSAKEAAHELNRIMRQNAVDLGFFSKPAWPDAPDDVTAEDLVIRGGYIIYGNEEHAVSFPDVCEASLWTGRQMAAFAWYRPDDLPHHHATGQGKAFRTYAFGCCVAEVEVDMRTGHVRVEKVTSTHDVGRAIHPGLIRGQICGGIVMGQGFGTMEEFRLSNGRAATDNYDTYLIPTALDKPAIQANIYESPDPCGTYGAKSIGEPATELIAAAIANAVRCAAGKRIRHNPASPERILLE